MRNLQECQAEVFRRSEERIKERKKRRNHILMLCIPLVLCLTTIGSVLLTGVGLSKSTDSVAPEIMPETIHMAAEGGPPDGVICSSVSVFGNGLSHLYTSGEDVQGIIDLIAEIKKATQTSTLSESYITTTTQGSSVTMEDDTPDKGYRILIQHSNGTSTEYLLIGSTLIDQTTHETFPINEDTYFTLKDLLGIPLY